MPKLSDTTLALAGPPNYENHRLMEILEPDKQLTKRFGHDPAASGQIKICSGGLRRPRP